MTYERLETYFQTRAQEVCAILGLFPILKELKNRLKNQDNRSYDLYVVFNKLSDYTSYSHK